MTDDAKVPPKMDEDLCTISPINYAREALKWQYNLISLGGIAAFAILSGSILPALLGAGVELMYLSLIPQSSRFRRLVRSWKYADEKRKRDEKFRIMVGRLPADLRKRYTELEVICASITRNYEMLSSTSKMFVEQIQRRLGGLMDAYLRLLASYQLHREYLQNIRPQEIKHEIDRLKECLHGDPASVQPINEKRIEILNKRLTKFDKSQENGKVIDAQCATIEDVLELIRDQSVNLRDPQEVNDQLDGLVKDIEHTEETVREVEAIFDLAGVESELPPTIPSRSSRQRS